MTREINKDYAFKYWPKFSIVDVDGFCGTITDVRNGLRDWWSYEYLVSQATTAEEQWVLEKDLKFADPWAEFKRLLKRHDWTYEMSDDHRVWQAGRAARDVLNNMYTTLSMLDEPRATILWNKYGI